MNKKILIIDDEKYVREMIQLRLQEDGYEVSIAEDATEGVNIAKIFNPDLIIIDLMMEGISGIDGIKNLRKESITSNTKILVLSGQSLEEDKKNALDAGANGFLNKPVLPNRLINEINKFFK